MVMWRFHTPTTQRGQVPSARGSGGVLGCDEVRNRSAHTRKRTGPRSRDQTVCVEIEQRPCHRIHLAGDFPGSQIRHSRQPEQHQQAYRCVVEHLIGDADKLVGYLAKFTVVPEHPFGALLLHCDEIGVCDGMALVHFIHAHPCDPSGVHPPPVALPDLKQLSGVGSHDSTLNHISVIRET